MIELNEFSIRLLVALVAGMAIGFERQWSHKDAGLRTHSLVAIGSAIYVLLSIGTTEGGHGDVTRIIGQVVVGIGFLGAGVILRNGINIQGLNSAGTIWCCSAIGCLAGIGWYAETLMATILILLINIVLKPLEIRVNKRHDTPNSSNP